MIKYNTILYEFDPVQGVFNKSNYQTDIEVSNPFPDRIRLEKRRLPYLNCEIVLTRFTGIRWNLITGLKPIGLEPGYFVGNRTISYDTGVNSRKTELIMILNNPLSGQLLLYSFPNFDTRTATQRMKAAKDFISFLSIKKGQS